MAENRAKAVLARLMQDVYLRAKTEAGYPATRYWQMLNRDGPLLTAKHRINSPNQSDGYTELLLRGRLDLTVEAMILAEPKVACLFLPEELERARSRLLVNGYPIT